MQKHSLKACLTPPEVARLWKCKADKVVAFIKRGELRAFDISTSPGVGRPRYRVPPDAIEEFEARRSGKVEAKPVPKRRPKPPADFVRYFS